MTYNHDNRWAPGASRGDVPEGAVAAYSARWIDMGLMPAQTVVDRQGAAWNDENDLDRLLARLRVAEAHKLVPTLAMGSATEVLVEGPLHIYMRRVDGYVYVDAWLDS